MKLKNKLLFVFIFLLMIFPSIVFAYSNKIILGGENVGIKVNSKYVTIVGFYEVNNKYIGEDAGLKIGDMILKINDINISSIDDMVKTIDLTKQNGYIKLTCIRDNKVFDTNLSIIKDKSGVYKTGLYVKDTISGLGTLTYVDPNTKIFGALGHEIADKYTMKKVDILDGTIYYSEVIGITPSKNGVAGSKDARFNSNKVYGLINSNTESGIFGKYTSDITNKELIEVGKSSDIKLGSAKIRTVIDGTTPKYFDINILEIDENNETKNILFEITDEELISNTGGVVAGMSGSPIIQNDRVIGAVTHVIVNDPIKGYGIFITTMLEEGEN